MLRLKMWNFFKKRSILPQNDLADRITALETAQDALGSKIDEALVEWATYAEKFQRLAASLRTTVQRRDAQLNGNHENGTGRDDAQARILARRGVHAVRPGGLRE